MAKPSPLYPLKFEPIYKEKVWGGRTLEQLGRGLPGDENTPIGESWEVADLGRTAVSGGGGEAARSVVANGPLAGATLHELMQQHGRALLGDLSTNEFGEFPLLVKFLDARQNLSVQVHPSEEYAAQHEGAYLKSEAWYIVDANPNAVIYKGVQAGVTPAEFRAAIERDAVEPLLIKVPVQPGDCHYLPSGTCHALGAGVLVAEVQTPSDTTFRVYDWGRTGRELHIDQAMQCIHFGPPDVSQYERSIPITGETSELLQLVETEFFRLDRVDAQAGHKQELPYDQLAIWMMLSGRGGLHGLEGLEMTLDIGETIYLPPGMPEAHVTFEDPTTWLEITFPQTEPKGLA